MFPYITVAVAMGGSILAGIFDLKTTEIPDKISLGMVATGLLINLLWSIVAWNPTYIFRSAAVGSVFFTFGLIMYLGGQWGGGDTKVLAGIGTLVPSLPAFSTANLLFPFSVALLINTFIVGAVYMMLYAVVFSFTKKEIFDDFGKRTVSSWKKTTIVSLIPLAPALFYYINVGLNSTFFYILALVPVFASIFILMKFLKSVEETGFEKEIDAKKLQEGDMLAEELEEVDTSHDPTEELWDLSRFLLFFAILPVSMYLFNSAHGLYFFMSLPAPALGLVLGMIYLLYRSSIGIMSSIFQKSSTRIRGLEKDEVKKIQKTRDKVKIREGVRFVPVFPAALLTTVYYGNLLMFIL